MQNSIDKHATGVCGRVLRCIGVTLTSHLRDHDVYKQRCTPDNVSILALQWHSAIACKERTWSTRSAVTGTHSHLVDDYAR